MSRRRAGVGLMLETPTWRANPDWGARLGYDAAALDRVNRAAVAFLHERREAHADLHDQGVLVGGAIGPRGDGYVTGDRLTPEEYADYHRPQLASFKAADADVATVLTLVGADEAIGTWSPRPATSGCPIGVGFTVETDGRLADGTSLRAAVEEVDAAGGPDWFLVNCAHPTHIAPGLDDGDWTARIAGLRPNASQMSHAELDEAEELDEGDPAELAPRCGRWSRASRGSRSWAAAAARTHAMSPRCGASEKLGGCPKTGSCTSSTRSPS